MVAVTPEEGVPGRTGGWTIVESGMGYRSVLGVQGSRNRHSSHPIRLNVMRPPVSTVQSLRTFEVGGFLQSTSWNFYVLQF